MEKENKILEDRGLDAKGRQALEENAKKIREAAIRQRRAESVAVPYYNPAHHDTNPRKC